MAPVPDDRRHRGKSVTLCVSVGLSFLNGSRCRWLSAFGAARIEYQTVFLFVITVNVCVFIHMHCTKLYLSIM